jgi:hypothetical protein
MSVWKSLLERMKDTRDELARKAAKKVARAALDSASKAAGSAGKALGRAFFGEEEGAAVAEDASRPDPFAKLKAAEAEKRAREHADKDREKKRAAETKKLDDDVDTELAAMKRKVGK